MKYELQYKQYSENSILIEWPSRIDEDIHQNLLFFEKNISSFLIKSIVEVIHGYSSLLIIYKHAIEDIYEKIKELQSLYESKAIEEEQQHIIWEIPVCYTTNFAQDLESFSNIKSLTVDEIIALHTKPLYRVYFIGFLPGFLYLGGLDPKLNLPRKESPSLNIKKGSVAIGGNQTGIYPGDSPGGWHVIGQSPIDFFNAMSDPPCFASPGDLVQFVSINVEEFGDIRTKIANKDYQLNSSVL